jgi:DNA polymerase IV
MRQILHIDMNSYFATVEQQANPKLRGKPIAVMGSTAKRSIIVAASIEAKRFGVKTATKLEDARKLCPQLILVTGEPRKYSWVTKKFIDIFEDYTDKVEIFSIDEAFLDVTGTVGIYGSAENIAIMIKQRIRDEIGSYISCSVGVAKNKFLAKTGSDLMKPDGLTVITDENVDEILLSLPLSEFCGIGRRIHQRLEVLGIENTQQLRDYPNISLNKEFGIASGEKLKRMAFGLDNSPVISRHDRSDAKSYGHSRTMNKNITDREEIRKHILLLSEKVATRMRKDGCMGKEVGLWIRFGDFTGVGKSHRISRWTHDGVEIYDAAVKILLSLSLTAPVRAIGVNVTKIQREGNVPRSLLEEDTVNDKILAAMDAVNNRFGDTVVTRARLVGTKIKEVVSGMGRDKF